MALPGRASRATDGTGEAPTRRRRLGVALIVFGAAVALVSLVADLAFREATAGGFGWKQVTAVAVGAAAVVFGAVLTARARRRRPDMTVRRPDRSGT